MIRIIDEPDVLLTGDEYAQFAADYQRDYMMYAGTPPTFESYCRRRKAKQERILQHSRQRGAAARSG